MLEGKIDELKVAQAVGHDQSKNPGTKLKLALILGIRKLQYIPV